MQFRFLSKSKFDITGVILTAIFLIVVVLGTWIAFLEIEKNTKEQVRDSLQTVLHTTHEGLYNWINHRLQDVKETAASPIVRGFAKRLLNEKINPARLSKSIAQKQLRTYIRVHLDKFHDKGFFIISPDRINIGSMRNENLGITNLIHTQNKQQLDKVFKGETVFIAPIRSDVILDSQTDNIDDNIATSFVVAPIYNNTRKIIAAFALRIDPFLNFTRITQLGRIGRSGETYAFNRQGVMITESRFDSQLKNIGLLTPGQRSLLNIKIIDPGKNLLHSFTSRSSLTNRPFTVMAQSGISGESGTNTNGYRDYRGVYVYGAWLWDHELDFGLAAEIDESDAMHSYRTTRTIIITVLSATVLLGLFLSFYLVWVRYRSEAELKKAHNELEARVKQRTHDLQLARDELEIANSQLSLLATTDQLTSLANRRSFDKHLDDEWRRCQRIRTPISLILIDVDYFKYFNDTYGHQAGDECLVNVGLVLRSTKVAARPGDLIARYGGEEFAIILSGTSEEESLEMATALCKAMEARAIEHKTSRVKKTSVVTISAGVASTGNWEEIMTPNKLIEMADEALYMSKSSGRNQATCYSKMIKSV